MLLLNFLLHNYRILSANNHKLRSVGKEVKALSNMCNFFTMQLDSKQETNTYLNVSGAAAQYLFRY